MSRCEGGHFVCYDRDFLHIRELEPLAVYTVEAMKAEMQRRLRKEPDAGADNASTEADDGM